jgi:hypothetical protein
MQFKLESQMVMTLITYKQKNTFLKTSCWSTSKHDSFNTMVEEAIKGFAVNHTLQDSMN